MNITTRRAFGEGNTRPDALPRHGVSIAIPVFNEELLLVVNTRRVIRYLEELGLEYQIMIGSNGSTDATVQLGRNLQRQCSGVEFFHLPVRGVGLAFREFARRARFPFLVSLDMDLSSDLSFVEASLGLSDRYDVVVGSKRLATQRRSIVRKTASDMFLWCARRLTGLPYDDYSIGAKAFKVEFLKEFLDTIDAGSSYVLDLCYLATLRGRPVTCVPVGCEDRRRSKFLLPREGAYKFARLFQLWMRHTVFGDISSIGASTRSPRVRAVRNAVAETKAQ